MRINIPEKIRRRVWVKLIKNLISNVPEDFNRILKVFLRSSATPVGK